MVRFEPVLLANSAVFYAIDKGWRKDMKPGNFILFTGIWVYPLFAALNFIIVNGVQSDFPSIVPIRWMLILIPPIVFPILITEKNIRRQKRGQTDFGLAAMLGKIKQDERTSEDYYHAAYPKPPQQYLSNRPHGFIVGKWGKQYVTCPIKRDGINGFVVGTPGSGKSVLLLSWIYAMMYRQELGLSKDQVKSWNFFMVDIKGELYEKLLHIKAKDYLAKEHPGFQVVQPSNRNSFGWDVFYRVRDNKDETQIIKTVNDISVALVETSGDNPYFTDNARKILSGVLYMAIKQGWGFVPTIQKLMRTGFDELLTDIVNQAESLGYGIVLDKLKGFVGKDGNESLEDIESTLKTSLDVFSYPDIEYAFDGNPNKTSPAVLDDGVTNLDLAIEEAMLETYRPIFRLIAMQLLRHAEAVFKEDDDRYTVFFFDEAARIGKVDGLDAAMSTLRSRHVALLCFFQSISQFKSIYPDQIAMTLLNLCEIKIFLSGSGDKESSDLVCNMVGEYNRLGYSYKRNGILGSRSDSTFDYKKEQIITGKDMMQLRERGEAIAFLFGTFIHCKRLRYWEDPLLFRVIEERKVFAEKSQRKEEPDEPEPKRED